MISKWIFAIGLGLAFAAYADASIPKSFEQSYVELQRKLEELKQKGGKVSAQTEKEMNELMVQMNHEHAAIKRELEAKNQSITQKVSEARKTVQEDWPGRVKRAFSEFGTGIQRAWGQLSKSEGGSGEGRE